ncbi:MAG: hypothetical protein KTR31_21085 [Myxococcales bacterium]|nr:hypothetical protein [Myxococcales bacterium]
MTRSADQPAPAVVGVAVRCAAGTLDDLRTALLQGTPHLSASPPYDSDGLCNPRCGRVAGLDRDRPAEALLREVVTEALREAALPPGTRIGLVVGTSSGNIAGPWERWHRATLTGEPADGSGTGRDAPTQAVAQELGLAPATTVCLACVSGTAALSIAEGWLWEGQVDAVVAAGVDALCLFVHAGFSGLGALASDAPRPFHPDRDGLVVGEGAAALVLADSPDPAAVRLLGSALSSDAVGMTAPDRQAGGAQRALRRTLTRSGLQPGDVDLVSIHGTGTRFNDAMEATALTAVFGAHRPAVHGVKQLIGHTMGAAGAIEAALLVDLLRRGQVPPGLQVPPSPDPDDDPAPALRDFTGRPEATPTVGLSMSAAFGGANAVAAFGVGAAPPPSPPPVDAHRRCGATVSDVDEWPDGPTRYQRADPFVRMGMLAVARLREQVGELPADTAIVGGSRTGCRIVDLAYHERLVKEGARRASRRLFTYTLPGAPGCAISLHWELHGAQLMFLDDPTRAEEEAARWVRQGRAPAAIALWCEAPQDDVPAYATATLWTSEVHTAQGAP